MPCGQGVLGSVAELNLVKAVVDLSVVVPHAPRSLSIFELLVVALTIQRIRSILKTLQISIFAGASDLGVVLVVGAQSVHCTAR